jgi:hypothetical protein
LAPDFETAAGVVDPGWLAKSNSSSIQEDRELFSQVNIPVFGFHGGTEIHDSGTVYVIGEWLVLAYLPKIRAWLSDQLSKCDDLESLQLAAINNFVSLA